MKKPADTEYMKTATAKVRWYNTKHRERGCVYLSRRSIRPGKLDLLFRINNLLNLHVGGQSLFITSKCCIHSANLRHHSHKSGHVIAWKAIMTVEAADLRGSGC